MVRSPTSGQVTQYHADCTPEVYGPGTTNGPTLVDSGNDERLIRNEGSVVATGFAVQLVGSGAPRRIDVLTARQPARFCKSHSLLGNNRPPKAGV